MHDDHVAGGLVASPAFGPQIQNVVQIDIGQERRNHRTLPRPSVTDRYGSVFKYARLQPFPDQADDALVTDTMLNEPDEPILADRIEEVSGSPALCVLGARVLTTDAHMTALSYFLKVILA